MQHDTNRPLSIYIADKAFGADDVTAVGLLQLLFDHTKVFRTSKKPSEREERQAIWLNCTHTYLPDRGFFDANSGSLLTLDDELNVMGLGICGQIWKAYGRLILQKFGAQDDDSFVFRTLYHEFLQPLDNLSKTPITQPGSIIYAVNMFNSVGTEENDHFHDAVMAVRPILTRVIQAQVIRSNLYLKEQAVMEAAFTDRTDEELLVLPSRCDSIHLFLKDYDPQQEVKFIIQPRNPQQNTWQVWAVDYKRRRFHVDVPLLTQGEVSSFYTDVKVRSIHGRYLAITCDRESAIELARLSVKAYKQNYWARLKRWWWDA